MKILGISYAHDSGACVIDNGKILSSINEERLAKIKMKGGPPLLSIKEALRIAKTKPEEIEVVAFADLRPRDFAKRTYPLVARRALRGLMRFPGVRTTQTKRKNLAIIRRFLESIGVNAEERFVEHHLCHAASAYYTSGFEECLVVTSDGEGDSISSTVNICRNNTVKRVASTDVYHSAGLFYSSVTNALGFKINRHEGKIVGLAAYGKPELVYDKIRDLISLDEKNLRIEGKIARWYVKYGWRNVPKELKRICQKNRREDVAAAFQKRLEEVLTELVYTAARRFSLRRIALAGGVFANVKLNQRIHELESVDEIFIHPAMGDAGIHLGAALQVCAEMENDGIIKAKTLQRLEHVYLGPEYSEKEIEKALQKENLEYEKYRNIERKTAELISEGKVVARFNGRMEYGPRALGNRSILALPTDPSINDWLNKRLKRTEFMPFAPSLLLEHAEDFCKNIEGAEHTAEFMTITFDVTKKCEKEAPAVVHVDRTSRPQFVP
ncbi:MAG: carbamoyl transferase [Spirochaetes bacterium]|nr:MAG: carbamoyl transferase [Spirochaetota bacterium]